MKIERLTAEQMAPAEMPRDFTLLEHWRARDETERDLAVIRVWQWGEHTIATLDVIELSAGRSVRLLLAIRRWLERRGEPVCSAVDKVAHPDAERVNSLLGFAPSDLYVGMDGGATRLMEVWQWHRQ